MPGILRQRGHLPRPRYPRLAPAVCLVLSVSCASQARNVGPGTPAPRQIAKEVTLTTRTQVPVLGKVIGVDGSTVTFLPSPYRGVETRTLNVDDIITVRVKRPGHGGRAAFYAFSTAFVVVGVIAGASSKYDSDYSGGLAGATVTGLLAALVGGVVGSITSTKTYHFRKMSPEQKRSTLVSLMHQ
jgi:uncharacterized membrane protein YeaQ/YmgE (transglycosylase-associated protein family)